jgi:hypothetical protein
MFTNEDLKRYQELLKICKEKGIVATNETKPVCIPLNNRRRVKRESFMQKAKNDLLGEFSK